MEYCAHCRAIRPTRKSSRKRSVRQPDGSMKTIVIDSYHCTRCNHFVGSVERELAPAAAAPSEQAAPGGETAAAEPEEAAAAATGTAAQAE